MFLTVIVEFTLNFSCWVKGVAVEGVVKDAFRLEFGVRPFKSFLRLFFIARLSFFNLCVFLLDGPFFLGIDLVGAPDSVDSCKDDTSSRFFCVLHLFPVFLRR